MEVKFTKYLLVALIALLFAVIFVTGASLVLIDLYVQPLPESERYVVFGQVEEALPDPAVFTLMVGEPAAVLATVLPLSVSQLGLMKGNRLDSRSQKPMLLTGEIALAGELIEPMRSYAEPTPAEVVMALPVDGLSDSVAVVTRFAATAVPTEPPATAAPSETIAPTSTAESPEPTATSTAISTKDTYVVRHGDSLSSIATQLGVTKAILMEVNGLSDQAVIHPGDRLEVPEITHIGVPDVGQIIWPVEARYIIKQYQYGHRAIDIVLPSGSPVVAVAAGTVEYAGWHQDGYGYMVYIDHGNGVTSLYAHTSAFHVKAGDVVEQGQLIADSGNTGNSTLPHLHLEIQANGQMLNPCLYLPDGC